MKTTANLLDQFTQKASEAGATVYRAEHANQRIAELARSEKNFWVSQAAADLIKMGRVSPIDSLEELLVAGDGERLVGVVSGRMALAETGSVLFVHEDQTEVWLTGISDILVVVVEEQSVVDSLCQASEVLSELSLAGQIWTLLTGPSRTADIERILTIGVHGCIELNIILL